MKLIDSVMGSVSLVVFLALLLLLQRLMAMDKVTVFDINRDRLQLFEAKFGCKAATSLPDAVEEAELVRKSLSRLGHYRQKYDMPFGFTGEGAGG